VLRPPLIRNLLVASSFGCAPLLAQPTAVLMRCATGYSQLVNSEKGQLNTDRLAMQFGPIQTQLVSQTPVKREVHFIDEYGVVRGYARSSLRVGQACPLAIEDAHATILAGGSMGKVFREKGFTIRKDNLQESVESLPAALRSTLGGHRGLRREYTFVAIASDGSEYPYAQVEEWTPQ
jgi:hypothetical protein